MSECMTQEDAMNMSNEQAVQILKPFHDMMLDRYGCPISDAFFALGKAIEALKREERKKGKWNFIGDQVFVCTECGACYSQSQFEYLRTRKSDPEFPYFCPMCGADMRGDADE